MLARLARIGAVIAAFLAATPAPAAEPVAVRVGFIPVLGSSQLFILDGEGWAREAGIDLRLTQFESGPNIVPALASGTIDVFVAGVAAVATARSKGVDVRVVAATAIDEVTLVADERLAGHIAAAGSVAAGFERFTRLEGRRPKLAAQPTGSVPNTVLRYWLGETVRASAEHYEIVPLGVEAAQQALLARAVDGGMVREPSITILRDRNPRLTVVARGGEMFPDQPGGVIAVSGRFADAQPQATQALVDMVVRATALIGADPERAAGHVARSLGKGLIEPDVIRRALTAPTSRFISDPRRIMEPVKRMQAYQLKLGTIAEDGSIEGLFEPLYHDRATGVAPR